MAALCHADTLTRYLARCARKEALSEAVDKQVAKDTPPSVPVTSCFLRGNYGQRRSHARTLSIYYPKTQSILMQAVCRASTRLRGHVTKRGPVPTLPSAAYPCREDGLPRIKEVDSLN